MNNLIINDFFCGCGGMGIGFLKAGFSIAGAWDINKYAINTYSENVGNHVQLRDIKTMNIQEIPHANVWTFGFPCFEKGTLVMTNRGYKEIENIVAGDRVLTHANRFKRVIKPMKQYCNKLYEVDIHGTENFRVTEEHPFYVRKVHNEKTTINGKVENVKKYSRPTWEKVSNLSDGHYIGIAINQESKYPKTNYYMYFNYGILWWIIGRYIRNGKLKKTYKDNTLQPIFRIIISCKKYHAEQTVKWIKDLYNCTIVKKKNHDEIHIENEILFNYLEQFGCNYSTKHITSDILNLPIDSLGSFIEGYFDISGYDGSSYRVSTVNKELAYGIQACVHKAFHRTCIIRKTTYQDKKENQKNKYTLSFKTKSYSWMPKRCKENRDFYKDGKIWTPFNKKKLLNFCDYVYNMEVDKDNSYTVYNLIVHNCQDISVAGNMSGIAVKCQECENQFDIKNFESFDGICANCGSLNLKPATRSGLFFEVMRLIDESLLFDKSKTPSILVAENVKALKPYLPLLETEFSKRGYKAYSALFNSKYWGVAQHRERYFIVGVHHSIDDKFLFPTEDKSNISKLSNFLDEKVDEKYYVTEEKSKQIISQALERLNGLEYVHATLTPARTEKRQQGRRAKENEEDMFTLTAQDLHGVIIDDTFGYDERGVRIYADKSPTLRHSRYGLKTIEKSPKYRVRNLTPTEYGRLQGFPMHTWKQIVSDSQAYKQFGNAVTVNVITAIAEEIKKLL